MNKNIFRCRICGRHAISEEMDLHECRPLKNYMVLGNTLQVCDGKLWYPLKLDQICPTNFDKEEFRRSLDRTLIRYG